MCVPQSVKTKETNPTRPGSPTPCKQALKTLTSWAQRDKTLRETIAFADKGKSLIIYVKTKGKFPGEHREV